MWTIGELKQIGKTAFKANYWKCVVAGLILSLFLGSTSISSGGSSGGAGQGSEGIMSVISSIAEADRPLFFAIAGGILSMGIIISVLLKIFLFNPLEVGCHGFFAENVKNTPSDLDVIKGGFSNYGNIFLTLFLRDLFLCLWCFLFIIPGIVKAYSYRMVPYILYDDPNMNPTEAIRLSRDMMNGHKWRSFLLDLSFIGWYLLSIFTLGLLHIFWTNPYHESTDAALYLELKRMYSF